MEKQYSGIILDFILLLDEFFFPFFIIFKTKKRKRKKRHVMIYINACAIIDLTVIIVFLEKSFT